MNKIGNYVFAVATESGFKAPNLITAIPLMFGVILKMEIALV